MRQILIIKQRSMHIQSTTIIKAIDFAKSHSTLKKWFDCRDESELICIKSVNSELVRVVRDEDTLYIRVSVDYIDLARDPNMIEDIAVYLSWKPEIGYSLMESWAVGTL